jgi:uncharacterized protein YcsI (UPF0317 family)
MAEGWAQANLVVLPDRFADDFRRFCELNPRPCPLLDVTEVGSPEPRRAAPWADLRVDLPRYRVYERGVLTQEVDDITTFWRPDLVGFLLGCSFTFEAALRRAGVPLRHVEMGCNVSMYRTNRMCEAAGPFNGPLVVSMRPIPERIIERAVRVTEQFPRAHGGPVHVGDPNEFGIVDLARPDYGDPVPINPGETPVFWACGVTPQAAAEAARIELMIAHAPGHMFITDLRDEELAEAR